MEIEPNNIYCGDCYELIKFIPDKSVDLVIIDPPYEFVMGGKGHSEIGDRKYKSKGEIYSLDTDITKKNIGTGYTSQGYRYCKTCKELKRPIYNAHRREQRRLSKNG